MSGFNFAVNLAAPNIWGYGQVITKGDPLTDLANQSFGLISRYVLGGGNYGLPVYALWGEAKQSAGRAGNNTGLNVGVLGTATANGVFGTTANMVGVYGQTNPNASPGTVTSTVGVQAGVVLPAAAVVTNATGLQVDPMSTGQAVNVYGLHIGNISAGTTNNYAIQTGSGLVSFGDTTYIAAGKGLNLGDTTLKNYQEGTFTPAFTSLTVVNGTGSATYTGRYTRIGNVVHWQAKIHVTGTCTTAAVAGSTSINNLPFSTTADANALVSTTQAALSYVIGDASVPPGINAYLPTWAADNFDKVITGTIYL